MFYTLLCLQYKNTPEIKKKIKDSLKFIIMKNMDAFDLMNINMTMYSSCKKKSIVKDFHRRILLQSNSLGK